MIIRRTHTIEFTELAISPTDLDDVSLFWKMIDLAKHLKVEEIPTAILMSKMIVKLYNATQHVSMLLNVTNIEYFQQIIDDTCGRFVCFNEFNLDDPKSIISKIHPTIRTVTGRQGKILSSRNDKVSLSTLFHKFYIKKMDNSKYRATRYLRELTFNAPQLQLEMTLQFGTTSNELNKNDYKNATLLIKTLQSTGYSDASI